MRVGIIGAGDMGRRYAHCWSNAGHEVVITDTPDKISDLEKRFSSTSKINVLKNASLVADYSELLIHAVPGDQIANVFRECRESIRPETIVGGSCSVKMPEYVAFRYFVPSQNPTFFFHSLYGPSVKSKGQTDVIIPVNITQDVLFSKVEPIIADLGTVNLYLENFLQHDSITAETQATTHLGFMSMGLGWARRGNYPWEQGEYTRGIDVVKMLMTMRLFSGNSHLYRTLAFENPFALVPIQQYPRSARELFNLGQKKLESELRERTKSAGDYCFDNAAENIDLNDEVMGSYALGFSHPESILNTNLSLHAMTDSWKTLSVKPRGHLICQTPLYRLRVGIAEYLHNHQKLYDDSIKAFMNGGDVHEDDSAFCDSADTWARIIQRRDAKEYDHTFSMVKEFFSSKLDEAKRKSDALINSLAEQTSNV